MWKFWERKPTPEIVGEVVTRQVVVQEVVEPWSYTLGTPTKFVYTTGEEYRGYNAFVTNGLGQQDPFTLRYKLDGDRDWNYDTVQVYPEW